MPRKAVNTSDSPVIIADDGSQLDGKTSGPVNPEHPFVLAALAAGSLVFATEAAEPGEPNGQPDPEVLARAEQLAGDTGARTPVKAAGKSAGAGKQQEA